MFACLRRSLYGRSRSKKKAEHKETDLLCYLLFLAYMLTRTETRFQRWMFRLPLSLVELFFFFDYIYIHFHLLSRIAYPF